MIDLHAAAQGREVAERCRRVLAVRRRLLADHRKHFFVNLFYNGDLTDRLVFLG